MLYYSWKTPTQCDENSMKNTVRGGGLHLRSFLWTQGLSSSAGKGRTSDKFLEPQLHKQPDAFTLDALGTGAKYIMCHRLVHELCACQEKLLVVSINKKQKHNCSIRSIKSWCLYAVIHEKWWLRLSSSWRIGKETHRDSNSTEHREIWAKDTMVQKFLYWCFQLKPKGF